MCVLDREYIYIYECMRETERRHCVYDLTSVLRVYECMNETKRSTRERERERAQEDVWCQEKLREAERS